MRILLLLALLLLPTGAFASGWSGNTTVESIFTHATDNGVGTIYFTFGEMINPDMCEKGSQIALVKGSPYESEIYSLFLSAFMSDKTVQYLVSGCTSNGYPKMKNTKLIK